MAADYDASDDTPLSKANMMSYNGAKRAAPWDDLTISCSGLRRYKDTHYIETAESRGTYSKGDLRTTDVCNFFLATEGIGTTAPIDIGELYVTYTVSLITPQMTAPATVTTQSKRKTIPVNMNGGKVREGTVIRIPNLVYRHFIKPLLGLQTSELKQKMTDSLKASYGADVDADLINAFVKILGDQTNWKQTMTPTGQYKNLETLRLTSAQEGSAEKPLRIDFGNLDTHERRIISTLHLSYQTGDPSLEAPMLGIDFMEVAKDLFNYEPDMHFDFTVAGNSPENRQYSDNDAAHVWGTAQGLDPNGRVVTLSEPSGTSTLTFKGCPLGLPSPNNSRSYVYLVIENFAGVAGAWRKFRVGTLMGAHAENSTTGAHECPMAGNTHGYRTSALQDGKRTYITNWPQPEVPATGATSGRQWYLWNYTKSYMSIDASWREADGSRDGPKVSVDLMIPVVNEALDMTWLCSTSGFNSSLSPAIPKLSAMIPGYQYSGIYDYLQQFVIETRRPK